MPVDAAPVPQGGNDVAAQIEQMAMEIINSVGPEGAAMLAETIMMILQSSAPQGEPVFKKGGKLLRRK